MIVKCKICRHDMVPFSHAKVLQKYNVVYYRCPNCEFIQTEEPYWMDEAYSSALVSGDLGVYSRSVRLSNIVSAVLKFCLPNVETGLDFGGGHGGFVRLMRDEGVFV